MPISAVISSWRCPSLAIGSWILNTKRLYPSRGTVLYVSAVHVSCIPKNSVFCTCCTDYARRVIQVVSLLRILNIMMLAFSCLPCGLFCFFLVFFLHSLSVIGFIAVVRHLDNDLLLLYCRSVSQGASVSIVSTVRYGQWLNSRQERRFLFMSSPSLGPTKPLLTGSRGLFPARKPVWAWSHAELRLRTRGAIPAAPITSRCCVQEQFRFGAWIAWFV
jgi:hypothetical protein